MIRIKIKTKINESSANNNKGLVKSDHRYGYIYTLINNTKFINLCQQLKNNYENKGEDPDISPKLLIDSGVVISSLRLGTGDNSCDGFSRVLVSGVSSNYRGQRQGEQLYKYVFSQHPEGLIPDRNYVSPSARDLWKRISAYSSIKKTKLSDECSTHTDDDAELLNTAYKTSGDDSESVIASADRTLDECANILEGLWDRDTLVYMIDSAGEKLYDEAIAI